MYMTSTIDWATPATTATASRTGTSTVTARTIKATGPSTRLPPMSTSATRPAADPPRAHERARRPSRRRTRRGPGRARTARSPRSRVMCDGQRRDERREHDRDQRSRTGSRCAGRGSSTMYSMPSRISVTSRCRRPVDRCPQVAPDEARGRAPTARTTPHRWPASGPGRWSRPASRRWPAR